MADGSQLVPIETHRSAVRVVDDFIPVLDTARFEHMQRIANVMAATSLVPLSLRAAKKGEDWVPMPREQVFANCFLVVNQATRWGMDPFAVAQCCSIVHGRLTYEGKLVAAVLDAKLGVRLSYKWSGDGDRMSVEVSGTLPDGVIETIEGSVADWRTNGKGTPWTPSNYRRMLAYRGAREWARLYAPAVMLGVYSDDEMDALQRQPAPRQLPPSPPSPPAAPRSRDAIDVQPVSPQAVRPSPPAPPSAPPPPARTAGPGSVAAPSAAHTAAGAGPPSPPPPVPAAAEDDPPLDGEALLAHVADELGACGDVATLDEAWGGFEDLIGRLSRRERVLAEALYEQQAKRIGGGS